jgi:hypothetical protein
MISQHTDHEMWRLIRNRVDQGHSMQAIADEIGLPVDELCEWIFRYREPRPAKPYQSKNGTPIGKVNVRPPGPLSMQKGSDSQEFSPLTSTGRREDRKISDITCSGGSTG